MIWQIFRFENFFEILYFFCEKNDLVAQRVAEDGLRAAGRGK